MVEQSQVVVVGSILVQSGGGAVAGDGSPPIDDHTMEQVD